MRRRQAARMLFVVNITTIGRYEPVSLGGLERFAAPGDL
jgi:hypothetical protein